MLMTVSDANTSKIKSLPEEASRPFWSVMIPTYNSTQYLEETLKSVLAQDPGTEEMQIEVVDDCSTQSDVEELVQAIGKGRVSFYRNPQNLGLLGNWDNCIHRAQGHWIHLLHQDDLVLPGFYEQLRKGINSEPTIGAAFCRYAYMDEESDWTYLSEIQRKTPGILEDWIKKIAVFQRIQFPSIVVKRSVYENLGGFCPTAGSAADWEMWKRIAVYYPIWYEPKIFACFRLHSDSTSSKLIQKGENILDTARAADISRLYLPSEIADWATKQAKNNYSMQAFMMVHKMLHRNNFSGAVAQLQAGFSCIRSLGALKHGAVASASLSKRWLKYKIQKKPFTNS